MTLLEEMNEAKNAFQSLITIWQIFFQCLMIILLSLGPDALYYLLSVCSGKAGISDSGLRR